MIFISKLFYQFFVFLRDIDFYTVNPEFALIKIEHSVTAFSGHFMLTHRKMAGSVVGIEGDLVQRYL